MTLNPRVDFAFKKLFGSEENKGLLIAFINAIVSEEDRISDVVLLNPYNNKQYAGDKLSILDIRATDTHGRHYNIEIQVTDDVYYNQRALYYWSRIYANQLQEGERYDKLQKTISIHVLNFRYFDEPDYHNVFHLLNVKTQRRYFEDIELHFIELDKFDKDFSQLKTSLDRWSNFLKRADRYERSNVPKEFSEDPEIGPAITALQHLYLDENERAIYDARLKWWRDEQSAVRTAEIRGLEEGLEVGETKARHELVRTLLRDGVLLEKIMQWTGLSAEEIAELKKGL